MERTRLGAAVVAMLLSCTMAACDGGVLTPKVNQATEEGEAGGTSVELPRESAAEGSGQAASTSDASRADGSDAGAGTAEAASSSSGAEAIAPSSSSSSASTGTGTDASTSASTDAATATSANAAQSSEDAAAEDSSFDQLAELLRPQGIKSTTAPERSITVSGTGSVSVVPDKASISVSVTTRADTAEQARSTHASQVASVVAAVAAEGVPDKDIQTTNAMITQVYGIPDAEEAEASEATEPAEEAEASLVATTGESVVVGYEMTTTIGVGEVDVDAVGDLIDACVAAGATGVNGPSYYVSGYDDAYEQALVEAVAHARAKAETLAEAVGAQVTQAISIEEGYESGLYRSEDGGVKAMGAFATSDSYDSYEISPGEVTIEAQVSVRYEIA